MMVSIFSYKVFLIKCYKVFFLSHNAIVQIKQTIV